MSQNYACYGTTAGAPVSQSNKFPPHVAVTRKPTSFAFASNVGAISIIAILLVTAFARKLNEAKGLEENRCAAARADSMMKVVGHSLIGDSLNSVRSHLSGAARIRYHGNTGNGFQGLSATWSGGPHVFEGTFVHGKLVAASELVTVTSERDGAPILRCRVMDQAHRDRPISWTTGDNTPSQDDDDVPDTE
jgi:hypothetical protein